jgi:hypothetical protein
VLIKLKTIVLQEVEVQLYFILFLYGAYTSIISQADADAKALNDLKCTKFCEYIWICLLPDEEEQ